MKNRWGVVRNPTKYLGNEKKYLNKVLQAESWSATSGSWNALLEQKFAEKFNSKYAISMNSGTATLHAALEALGVKRGDEVITPGLTVIMDTTSILHANAIPVYADVDEETFNIDPVDVEKKITSKTKAIIAVALYGLPSNLKELKLLSKKYNIPLIEDNAQCYLSVSDNNLAGTVGDISSWSFENTKHISCGEGGIVTTNDEATAIYLRKFAGHGFKNLTASEGRVRLNQEVFQDPNYKRHDSLGWNYRLPEFNAAVALAQLERIDEMVDVRIKVANMFLEVIDDSGLFITQNIPLNSTHSYYTLGVRYVGENMGFASWKIFRESYVQNGGDGIYGCWSVPYQEPLIASREFVKRDLDLYNEISYENGLCPVAERIQPEIMQFKTNYRSLKLAEKKARVLRDTIKKLKA